MTIPKTIEDGKRRQPSPEKPAEQSREEQQPIVDPNPAGGFVLPEAVHIAVAGCGDAS
jgi:hypothetical protein